MNELNAREQELVIIGAAIACNCVSCIEKHIPDAKTAGISDAQIGAAVKLAEHVRQAPARKALEIARSLLVETGAAAVGNDRLSKAAFDKCASTNCC